MGVPDQRAQWMRDAGILQVALWFGPDSDPPLLAGHVRVVVLLEGGVQEHRDVDKIDWLETVRTHSSVKGLSLEESFKSAAVALVLAG